MAINDSDSLILRQTHANTRATPVSRLPWDLLYEIFAETVASSSLISASHTALKIAQVCRSWRDVARSMGRLWAYHSSENSPQPLKSTLARSAQASLFVEIRVCDVASTSILLRHLSRIEELSVHGSGKAFIRAREDAVRLRKLSLNLNDCWVDMETIEILQGWNTPKLTTLSISNGNLSSVLNLVASTLTTLSLCYVSCTGTSGYQDPIIFVDALQNLPSLQHLRLQRTEIAYEKIIRLPALCSLYIEDCLFRVDRILRHIDLSSTVRISVDLVTVIWWEEPARDAITDRLVNKVYRAMAKTPDVDPVIEFNADNGRLHIVIHSCECASRESCLCREPI